MLHRTFILVERQRFLTYRSSTTVSDPGSTALHLLPILITVPTSTSSYYFTTVAKVNTTATSAALPFSPTSLVGRVRTASSSLDAINCNIMSERVVDNL